MRPVTTVRPQECEAEPYNKNNIAGSFYIDSLYLQRLRTAAGQRLELSEFNSERRRTTAHMPAAARVIAETAAFDRGARPQRSPMESPNVLDMGFSRYLSTVFLPVLISTVAVMPG